MCSKPHSRPRETGFSGGGDTQRSRALDSTQGFTFLLGSLEAFLEHDIGLGWSWTQI